MEHIYPSSTQTITIPFSLNDFSGKSWV